MKPTITLIITAFCTAFIFSACKKGEDDPFLSFRTRKTRVTGEWKVSKMESYYSSVSEDYSHTINTTYDGTTETTTNTHHGPFFNYSETTTQVYKEGYTFRKDGSFSYSYTSEDENSLVDGTWTFLGKNQKENLKNKEAIILNHSQNMSGNIQADGGIIRISQLKNKEMVWQFFSSSVAGTTSYTNEQTITLSQD
ncbi:MAG: hypothetical protein ACO1O6_10140 [Bacteroidota bacterium]